MDIQDDERAKLRQILETCFALEELKTLAFDLGANWEDLPSNTASGLSRELVGYFERRNNFGLLITEILKQRPTNNDRGFLNELLEKLPQQPSSKKIQTDIDSKKFLDESLEKLPERKPPKKIQIVIQQNSIENETELRQGIAAMVNCTLDDVAIIGIVGGSMRLLLSLPDETANLFIHLKPKTLIDDKYSITSIVAFDSLDLVSQNTWRYVVLNQSPVRYDEVLYPTIFWQYALKEASQKIEETPQENIEFVNRVDELDLIRKRSSPRFTLVDGPAGYGKTYLLHKIKETYENNQREKWKAAYIDLKRDPSIRSDQSRIAQLQIANAIIRQFTSSPSALIKPVDTKENDIPNRLVPFLIQQRANVLLLWDGVEVLPRSTSTWLKHLMYKLDEGLKLVQCKLRVVFSGRYISVSDWGRGAPYPLKTILLTPFNSMAVQEMINRRASNLDIQPTTQFLDELTWQVLHISGGHPQGICRVLDKIVEAGFILPDIKQAIIGMVFPNGEQTGTLFQICIEPIIQTLISDLKEPLLETFKNLSPIRRFDPEILDFFLQEKLITVLQNQSSWDLIRDMLRTHLISPPNKSERMFSDQIVRRMLAMQLQLNNADFFNKINAHAQRVFHEWACNREQINTEVWRIAVIESLYHTLQMASDDKPANVLHNSLIERLNVYIAETDDPRDLLQLKDALAKDIELNDLINRRTGGDTMQILLDSIEDRIWP